MQNWPRITIVTPSYNQGHYLNETIQSILSQNYPNLEYFIVDGGSQDNSVSIIKSVADQLSWWVSEPDDGQTDAINKGFKRATGDLLCWVNSDDVLLPGCLHAVAACYLAQKPDIIHTDCIFIDQESCITRAIKTSRQTRFFMLRGAWYALAPSIFFSHALMQDVDYLNPQYHLSMDVDIWLRMVLADAKIAHISEYYGAFRWHTASKTSVTVQKRGTSLKENEETTYIYDTIVGSTQKNRWRWRKIRKALQVLNMNYVKAYRDTKRMVNKNVHDIFKEPYQ